MGYADDELWEEYDEEWDAQNSCSSLQQDFENNIWTTRDGTKLSLYRMKTSHIKNCLRHIERSENQDKCCYGWGTQWIPILKFELLLRGEKA